MVSHPQRYGRSHDPPEQPDRMIAYASSEDVAWFDVDDLPANCAPGFHE